MEGKTTFVMYSDFGSVFSRLTDEEAGKLIKHLFAYVNDENPVLNDRLLEILFEPIKCQLKRDLKKWQSTKCKRSESGKQGGLKSGEARRNKANEANASQTKQTEANEAVNVNDNVNVNVNVNNNVIYTPSQKEFLDYCSQINGIDFKALEFSLKAKYDQWNESNWKDGHGKKIKNWKTKIRNTIPHLKPIYVKQGTSEARIAAAKNF